MKITQSTLTLLSTALFAGALSTGTVLAEEKKLANIHPSGITWNLPGGYAEAELSVGGEASVHRLFERGETPVFQAQGDDGIPLPDGYYSYQITMTPQAVVDDKAAHAKARAAGDEDEFTRLSNQLQESSSYDYYQESGDFRIISGAIEAYDVEQEQAEARVAHEAAEEQAAWVDEET